MNLETIKQYIEQHLTLTTNLGIVAIALTGMFINNKVNNGGVFTFRNPNNEIVQKFNGEIGKIVQKKEEEINEEYKDLISSTENKFKESVKNITDSNGKLENAFLIILKGYDAENTKLESLISTLSGSPCPYSSIIGGGLAYETKEQFMKIVDSIRDKKIKEAIEGIKPSDVDVNKSFAIKDNKIALKPQETKVD